MPHSQGLSNNPYPEPNQPNSSYYTKVAIKRGNLLKKTKRSPDESHKNKYTET
jgi:hypothetical protein